MTDFQLPVFKDFSKQHPESEQRRFIVESPLSETPSDDVACAWCGLYVTLYGPLSCDGVLSDDGDMVCRVCAEKEGFDVDSYITDTDDPNRSDQ